MSQFHPCRPWVMAAGLGAASIVLAAAAAWACPFCSAVSVTLGEELKGADAAVIASFQAAPPVDPAAADDPLGAPAALPSKFKVVDVLKGDGLVKPGETIDVVFFGDAKPDASYLILGVDPPRLVWSTPVALSPRAVEYVKQLPRLPESGADRLAFFQDFFEDAEEMLARDAYDEFAKAPYSDVKDLKPRMDRQLLLNRIHDKQIPASRRRLYLTMLGVCGQPEDVPQLEALLKSDDREMKTALDALVACYLMLKGPDGMPLVEDLFLRNPQAEYTDTYSAIMALRFHGQEQSPVPKDRLLQGFRLMLDRPQLADLVIPDLARWEDWSAVDRLVELFKNADDESNWVRVPVINYLRVCPEPRAKQLIDELAEIDPDAVKRANSFFPLANGAAPLVPPPTDPAGPAQQPVADAAAALAESGELAGEATAGEASPAGEAALANDPRAAEEAVNGEPPTPDPAGNALSEPVASAADDGGSNPLGPGDVGETGSSAEAAQPPGDTKIGAPAQDQPAAVSAPAEPAVAAAGEAVAAGGSTRTRPAGDGSRDEAAGGVMIGVVPLVVGAGLLLLLVLILRGNRSAAA